MSLFSEIDKSWQPRQVEIVQDWLQLYIF